MTLKNEAKKNIRGAFVSVSDFCKQQISLDSKLGGNIRVYRHGAINKRFKSIWPWQWFSPSHVTNAMNEHEKLVCFSAHRTSRSLTSFYLFFSPLPSLLTLLSVWLHCFAVSKRTEKGTTKKRTKIVSCCCSSRRNKRNCNVIPKSINWKICMLALLLHRWNTARVRGRMRKQWHNLEGNFSDSWNLLRRGRIIDPLNCTYIQSMNVPTSISKC